VLVIAAAALQIAAASPTPDLREFLAPAPGADWLEAPAGPNVINGPFSAHDWAVYVEDDPTERALNRDGFVTGYGRAFEQKVTQDFLEEQVFQFKTASGAGHTYDAFKIDAKTDKNYKSEFPAWDSTTSWGVEFANDQGDRMFSVQFRKGSLLFIVNLWTQKDDLSASVVDFAHKDFDLAPETTELAASAQSLPQAAAWVIALSLFALVVLVLGVIFVLVRRRPTPVSAALAAGGVQMSDDGSYWWDGVRWRSAATDVPPTAQRSADGAYWWDGKSWRRTGQ
jgi:hypothetical protein